MATTPGSADHPVFVRLTQKSVEELKQALRPEVEPEDDGSNHFTRLVAPFLAGFALSQIVQLVTSSPPSSAPGPSPLPALLWWRDPVLLLFIVGAGLLLAGFQLSIGSLYKHGKGWIVRPLFSYAGVACVTGALIMLTLNSINVTHWFWINGALIFLGAGLTIPILMRIGYWVFDEKRRWHDELQRVAAPLGVLLRRL